MRLPPKPRRALRSEDYELIYAKTRTDLPDEDHPAVLLQELCVESGER